MSKYGYAERLSCVATGRVTMTKTIFISCGQYTPAEKQLGKQISEMVRTLTDCVPFFAEEVQDLNGLDANILSALHDCVGFITIMHPRGEIRRPNGSVVRASVWIEQEIAIATYIQRIEKRTLPIIAFKHKSVGREGIRDLLHLNPFEFTDESEILTELPTRLAAWRSLKPSGVELQLTSKAAGQQEGHDIRRLEITLLNGTNRLIEKYEVEVRLPSSILKHWSTTYPTEVRRNTPDLRYFRFDQNGRGGLRPHDRLQNPITFDYCTTCAIPLHESEFVGAMIASELRLGAMAWVEGNEYIVEKTIKQLAIEGEGNR
jgi:hypothetical protein